MTNSSDRCHGDRRKRRLFGRFSTRLPISTRRDDLLKRGQAGRRAQCRLHLQDFSLGGLRAESSVRLKVNERVTLRLPPTTSHPALQLTGRVIHCRRRQDRYQVGIEFCQTREGTAASPFCHLPRLFCAAIDSGRERRPTAIVAKPLTLAFDVSEFCDTEIAEIIGLLSDVYRSIGGDELVISDTELPLQPAVVEAE